MTFWTVPANGPARPLASPFHKFLIPVFGTATIVLAGALVTAFAQRFSSRDT